MTVNAKGKIELTADEQQVIHAAFDIYKATQLRAANNAKNQVVKDAYNMSARSIQQVEVKLFEHIA